jgi:exopolysaccharide biosynthesis protein
VAISGSLVLLDEGTVKARDDVALHPRTAIGVDHDSGHVMMLVIDGRQSFSRGYTLVELARMMRTLGAEDALNLDGGGSSTLVAASASGVVGVRNSPSDGGQRPVPNGLGITYTAPVG